MDDEGRVAKVARVAGPGTFSEASPKASPTNDIPAVGTPGSGGKSKRSRAREDGPPEVAEEPLGPRAGRGKRRRATDYEEGYEVPTRQTYTRASKTAASRGWETYDIKPDPDR